MNDLNSRVGLALITDVHKAVLPTRRHNCPKIAQLWLPAINLDLLIHTSQMFACLLLPTCQQGRPSFTNRFNWTFNGVFLFLAALTALHLSLYCHFRILTERVRLEITETMTNFTTDPMNDIKTDPMFDFTAKPMMTDIIAGPSLVQKECGAYLRLLDINFRLHAIN